MKIPSTSDYAFSGHPAFDGSRGINGGIGGSATDFAHATSADSGSLGFSGAHAESVLNADVWNGGNRSLETGTVNYAGLDHSHYADRVVSEVLSRLAG